MAKPIKRKASKKVEVTTILNLYTVPNKNEKLLGMCSYALSGKTTEIRAHEVAKMDISKLDVITSPLVKDLFAGLHSKYELTKGRWTVKSGYGISIGVCDTLASYKAMFSHHANNGANSIVVNGNKHFSFAEASSIAMSFGITIPKGKGEWGILVLTESNRVKAEKFAVKLLGMKARK